MPCRFCFARVALSLLLPLASAFEFWFTEPTFCEAVNVQWEGGTPPFNLLVTPIDQASWNYTIPSSAFHNNIGNFSTPPLNIVEGHSVILTMSDATGLATGGTSPLLPVQSALSKTGSTGGTCNTPAVPNDFDFGYNDEPNECDSYLLDWDKNASQPMSIIVMVPLGETFLMQPPVGDPQYWWDVNLTAGTQFVVLMTDATGGTGGTSTVLTVGASGNTGCLSATPTGIPQPMMTTPAVPGPAGLSSTTKDIIIGVTIGGALLLLLLAFLLWRRHRNRNRNRADVHSEPTTWTYTTGRTDLVADAPIQVTPAWTLQNDPYFRSYHAVPFSATAQPTNDTPRTSTTALPLSMSSPQSSTTRFSPPSSGRKQRGGAMPSPAFEQETFLVHTDAGAVDAARANVVELPPAYNPYIHGGSSSGITQ